MQLKKLVSPAHYQFSMSDSLYGSQPVCKFRQTVSHSHYSSYMQAKILIDIILRGRQHQFLMCLLYISNLSSNVSPCLVIHDNDCTRHDVIALPFLLGDVFFLPRSVWPVNGW